MEFMEIGKAKYIALESFKKSGVGIVTPVWITSEGNKHFVWTAGDSWKVKRIRNNPHVRIAESDARGNPKGEWVDAHAAVLDAPEEDAKQRERIAEKYGMTFRLFQLADKLRRHSASRVSIELSPFPAEDHGQ